MESFRPPETLPLSPKRGFSSFIPVSRPLLLAVFLSSGCSSQALQEEPPHHLSQRWDHREQRRYAPWGEQQPLVDQTRQNITLFVYAVLEYGSEGERSEALREVLHLRTEIEHYELVSLGKQDEGLAAFIVWLHKTNQWVMKQRERLLPRD